MYVVELRSEDEAAADAEAWVWLFLELDFNGLSFCLLLGLDFVILITFSTYLLLEKTMCKIILG